MVDTDTDEDFAVPETGPGVGYAAGMSTRYRMTRVSVDHPLANLNATVSADGTTVQVAVHRLVLWNAIGPGSHPCHWCGTEVRWGRKRAGTLQVDHVDGDTHNNALSNLVPACGRCNTRRAVRGAPTIRDDEVFITQGGRRYRAIEKACARCGKVFRMLPWVARRSNGTDCCSRVCASVLREAAQLASRVAAGEQFVMGADGKRLKAVPRTCEWCGEEFLCEVKRIEAGFGRLCSRQCRSLFGVAVRLGRVHANSTK